MSKTIFERMNNIAETMKREESEDSRRGMKIRINDENLAKAEEDIAALRQMLGMNTMQVLIMIAVVALSSRSRFEGDDLARYLGMEYLKFLSYSKDLDELKRRGYIRLKTDGDIVPPKEVLRSFKSDKPLEPEPTTGLSTLQLLVRLRRMMSLRSEDEISDDDLISEIDTLMADNPETSIAKVYNGFKCYVTDAERVMFIAVLLRYQFDNDDELSWYNIDDYFDENSLENLQCGFNAEVLELQRKGIIVFAGSDGMLTKEYIKISDEVKEKALADIGGMRKKERNVTASSKITASTIRSKELFYNPAEMRQVDQLQELLSEERFSDIRTKMKDLGLRTGFSCLFYGGPGTGKTETVYQIARKSGRDLFVVDVSQVKSCWVGESEKNIKQVFSRYRECVKGGGAVPILLFNEADAVFGIRQEGAGSAVDKMENSIQNIILQEMEDLDGILIATTNLTCNLDKAFERRFLYKIRFEKPSVEAKSRIWKTMIPELGEAEALQLASDFDFSGGQIENIARKKTVKSLISGETPTYTQIREYCQEETIGDSPVRRKIGF